MPCEDWFGIEKQYRVAVHTYCDAVDRLDSTKNFDAAWEHIELARVNSDRVRSALLRHQQAHQCVPLQGLAKPKQGSGPSLDEDVLGDQGQPGG